MLACDFETGIRYSDMRRKREFRADANGRFAREIGWKEGANGKLIQHRFYLGDDREKAEIANLRLEQLWRQIEAWHNEGSGNGSKPTWDEYTLGMGKAVAAGATTFVVPVDGMEPESYVRFVRILRDRFGSVITIVGDDEVHGRGVEELKRSFDLSAQLLANAARFTREKASVVVNVGPTLHQALDAYAAWIGREYVKVTEGEPRLTDWGVAQVANVKRLKEHHQDIPLATLGYNALEEMFRHWRQRPLVKGRNRKMSKDSADGHVYQLKQFIKWLHSCEAFDWRKPEDFDAIKTKVDADKDKLARRLATTQVDVYTLDELRLLSEYARPIERVLMLLGLNCGFGKMEVGTLRLNEVALRQRHPYTGLLGFDSSDADSFIWRVRGKSGVYGEWLLWPQTVAALEWAIQRRMAMTQITKGRNAGKDITAKADSVILLGRHGHCMVERTRKNNTNQQIPARWNALTERIRKDHPEFRRLSYGKLRKTAASLVRRFADGEIAGVFLAHGQPAKSDDLLEIYSNRPFGKVFDALRRVGEYLQPVFHAAPPDPFSVAAVSSSLNISLGTVKEIKRLRAEGVGPTEIARRLGVSRMTVYYHTRA